MANPAGWAELEERLQRAREAASELSPAALDRMSRELEGAAQLLAAWQGPELARRLPALRDEWSERAELLAALFEMRLEALTPDERSSQATGWISLEG